MEEVDIATPHRRSTVALIKSSTHYSGVQVALQLIADQIIQGLKNKRQVLVKPNFVSTRTSLAATHVDAVRAVLDFITNYYSGKIIVGEGPSAASFMDGLINFGYLDLEKEYGVEFVDLNEDEGVMVEGWDQRLNPLKLRIAKTVVESDYRISVTRPKTHDTAIITLSLKNMAVGSLVDHDKSEIHRGFKAINLNIAKVAQLVMPHLGVIDGYIGMEGNGPIFGDPVKLGMAAASTDPVALDVVVARVMGFNPLDIGYLNHLIRWKVGEGDLSRITLRGVPIEEVEKKFRPHASYPDQLKWK